ncbi:WxcM-like domain-containing protein [Flavobacterium sp. F-328]|uniref:WxcM-like domain-containing protein n=1 Tax=Flavobacterium erciyesense TaxID=2825842 RepID=A0ABS5D6J5_9FLAO|nr:WxcM-like domain-containing protein [Flavobacterium erciyesense]MBQ0909628.1 WxcM-like domain-containing protein [Flavobacterium erciyesense]
MKVLPQLIKGNSNADDRGVLHFNNDFNAFGVKRIYTIQNRDTKFVRGWQGHKIEQRWFSAIQGSFKIFLIAIDDWNAPSTNLIQHEFILDAQKMDVLHVPSGYVSSIQSLEKSSKLLLMSDYLLGDINDEYRYDINYFTK